MKIMYNFSESCYDPEKNAVRISSAEHNNLVLDELTGAIRLKSIPTSENKLNTPGNGIDGTVGSFVSVVRLNSSVSRKVAGDPTPGNEGVVIPDLLNAYFASLEV